MKTGLFWRLAILAIYLTATAHVEASCRLAGEQLAASCQQYRSAAAAFPELTGKDNDTLEVPIDKVKIWGWWTGGHKDCQQYRLNPFCRCCLAFAHFLEQGCRCNAEAADWMTRGGVQRDQFHSLTLAAAIACGKFGNLPLRDPDYDKACKDGPDTAEHS